MIIDLQDINEIPEFFCDLCVIGTGAAGLAIASEMLNTRHKIMLIESGGIEHEKNTQALYDTEIVGLPHLGSTNGRFRIHGGSTTMWAGQALPLTPIDFERRDWVPYSGWPISFYDLMPYYIRATQFLLVDQMNFDTDLFSYLKVKPPTFDHSRIRYHFSKWSPTPNLRNNHLEQIKESQRCTLLLHANVTKIELDKNFKSAKQIEVHSLTAHKATVRAKYFVICTGGIETARLLLSNNQQQLNGIGNNNDLVGRFFQDHPNAMIGQLQTKNSKAIQHLFNVFHKKNLKYTVRCSASEEWQHTNQLLNMSSGITFLGNEAIYENLKDVYKAIRDRDFNLPVFRKLLIAAKHPIGTLSPAIHYLTRGRSYVSNPVMRIGLTSEQEPNPESRVMLSEHCDMLGLPKTKLQWKLTELTRHTIQKFSMTLRDEFQRSNMGDIVFEPWLFDQSANWESNLEDQFHHCGTTRMHNSVKHGVVDRHCCVHDIENLYIGSSSVFPTSGHSNPTLTIIALCMRLADRLKNIL